MDRNRKMIRDKPTSFSQGLGKGLNSVAQSSFSGLAGVVNKPTEGFKRDGIKGLLAGTF
jgi:hypothetical protein